MINWFKSNKSSSTSSSGKKKGGGGLREAFRETTLPLISPRRGRRLLRREQLFSVVRESMIRGGVLSASYEFKVLALDSNGDSFLVLIDLSLPAQTMPDEYLLEIERWIQIAAQSRHSMKVRSVYWRRKVDEDAQGVALRAAVAAQKRSSGGKDDSATAIPAPPKTAQRKAVQPLAKDEVDAFRKALDGAQALPERLDPRQRAAERMSAREAQPGHEPESVDAFDALSETQYGKLE